MQMSVRTGTTRLNPTQYAELVGRIVANRHGADVIARMRDYLGERAARLGPADLSRNVLVSWLDRVCRAYALPPMVADLDPVLAQALGDVPSSVTVQRYGQIGGRPMPTPAMLASAEAQRYEQAAGYSGVLLGWSRRSSRLSLEVVQPDALDCEYASNDPSEPTIIRRKCRYIVDGKPVDTIEVYDLSDLDAPSYRIIEDGGGEGDLTERIAGRTYEGAGYLWRYASGLPYHRIVVRGHPDRLYQRLPQVEASLVVPMRWTAWGTGTDFASHPGRNVKNMKLIGTESGPDGVGFADGPEVIKRWVDTDESSPGQHWQDAPAYDPLTSARAIALYESLTLSQIDLPMDFSGTGGEPSAREVEALEERIAGTLTECRRFDGELLRRCAALANRLPQVAGDGLSEAPYALLYRGEIAQALGEHDVAVAAQAEEVAIKAAKKKTLPEQE